MAGGLTSSGEGSAGWRTFNVLLIVEGDLLDFAVGIIEIFVLVFSLQLLGILGAHGSPEFLGALREVLSPDAEFAAIDRTISKG